jgi:hypothetical protein
MNQRDESDSIRTVINAD